jgi:uncharacterized membrane protein
VFSPLIPQVYSEWHLHRERKKGYAPWGARFLNEALLVLVALFMLGGSIASTILVMHHSAVVTGVPPAVQELAMKAFNLSVRYRDYFCYYAMALSWVTFGVYVIVTALVIAAGLYYRKEAAQHRREQAEEKPTGAHIEAEA